MHTEQIHLLTSSHAFAAPKCGKCCEDLFPRLLCGLLVALSLVLHWLFTLRGDAGSVMVSAVTVLLVLSHQQQCHNAACYGSCLKPLWPIFVHSSLGRALSEDHWEEISMKSRALHCLPPHCLSNSLCAVNTGIKFLI